MLNIYYGNECIDKERFLFQAMEAQGGRTILIVPDQFSAQTERNAFFYLGKTALMDVVVTDFDRLGRKAIQEAGLPVPPLIDKYGRHMLLTEILRQEDAADHLSTYRGMSTRKSFVTMMNSLISEMKRNEVGPEALEGAMDVLDERTYLKRKLQDITHIFRTYEEAIQGKYLDSEDYITFYGDAILNAQTVKDSAVWITGFDTFTNKNLLVIARLLAASREVNIIMDWEEEGQSVSGDAKDAAFLAEESRRGLFALTGGVIARLEKTAQAAGHETKRIALEGPRKDSIWAHEDGGASGLALAACTNPYAEAETAASYILELARDKGYRYRDITVICNDMQGLGAILKRTLDRWNIPAFMDQKRTVLHHPAVQFVISLMDIASEGFDTARVMNLVKSDLMGFASEEADLLENYAFRFRIKGSAWTRTFTRKDRETDEEMATLNGMRQAIVDAVAGVKDSMGRRNRAEDKVRGLYRYLTEAFDMEGRLEAFMDRQEAAGFLEAASETAQSWNVICRIFDQIVEVAGDQRLSNRTLRELITSGLEEMEIGLVPASTDSVLIGTLQRTRLSRTKVLLVIGANEGILPMEGGDEGILTERELEELDELKISIGKTDVIRRSEEALAIYRNLTAPEQRLYMSCSMTNRAGEEILASRVFRQFEEHLLAITEAPDIRREPGSGSVMDAISTPSGTLGHLADAIRDYSDTGVLNPEWIPVIDWYMDQEDPGFYNMVNGRTFTGRLERLGDQFADALYMGDAEALSVSVSRLEKYSGCPFSHFMNYGLRPEELSPYEIGARETGDIFHACLMKFSQRLAPEEGCSIGDAGSPWMQVTDERCEELVRDIVTEEMGAYMAGTIEEGGLEQYKTRRIISICTQVAKSLVSQVQKGQIRSMDFEKRFGRGSDIPPIRIKVGEKSILLRGIIDRLDVLDTGDGGQAVRIVDYKTGNDEIKKEYFEAGYKLQLMVYMNAVLAGQEQMEPAGVFHFHISEMDEADDDGKAGRRAASERRDRNYRLKGFVLGEERIIRAMDGGFETESDVIPVKQSKDASYKAAAKGKIFSREEFADLCGAVEAQVQRICDEISSGAIEVAPRRTGKDQTACRYCGYKSVCLFDTSLSGCRYVNV